MCTSASMCSAQHRWVVVVVSGGMKRPYPTTSLGSRMTTPHRFVALRWTAHQTSCYRRWFPVCLARRRNGQAGRAGGAMRCGVVWSAVQRARETTERRHTHSLLNHCVCTYLPLIATGWVSDPSVRRLLLALALKGTSEGMVKINTCPATAWSAAAALLLPLTHSPASPSIALHSNSSTICARAKEHI